MTGAALCTFKFHDNSRNPLAKEDASAGFFASCSPRENDLHGKRKVLLGAKGSICNNSSEWLREFWVGFVFWINLCFFGNFFSVNSVGRVNFWLPRGIVNGRVVEWNLDLINFFSLGNVKLNFSLEELRNFFRTILINIIANLAISYSTNSITS